MLRHHYGFAGVVVVDHGAFGRPMGLTGWAMTPIMLLALSISVWLLLFELLIPNIQTGTLATRQTDSRCERYRIGISYSNFFTNGKLAIDRERVLHGHGVTRYLKWEQGCAWLGRAVNGIIQIFFVIRFFVLISRLSTSSAYFSTWQRALPAFP